jgi:hypothetical protein
MKELKYVQLGLLSDSPRHSLYQIIGYYITGLEMLRCMRQSSDLEAYHQHKSRSVSVHARGASGPYHVLRQGWFDWFWNGRALVRGRQIPDPGTSWFWLVDMTQQILREVDIGEVPVFFRVWPTTDTSLQPILNRGIYTEAVAAAAASQDTTNLVDPEELRRVLQHPEMVAVGDVLGLRRATGLNIRKTRLLELAAQIGQHGDVAGILNDHGANELSRRLQATAGSAPPPPRPAAYPSLASEHPAAQAMPLVFGSGGGSQSNVHFSSTQEAENDTGGALPKQSRHQKYRESVKRNAEALPEKEKQAREQARRSTSRIRQRLLRQSKKNAAAASAALVDAPDVPLAGSTESQQESGAAEETD